MTKKRLLIAFEIGSIAVFSALLLSLVCTGVHAYLGYGHLFPHLNV